jgi:anti-anti-sigma factor
MPLTVTHEFADQALKITLDGELDAGTAPALQAVLEKAAGQRPQRVVLYCAGLTFMASAGVRMLIFARQKIGGGVRIHVIAPQQQVLDTLKRTGMLQAVTVADSYPG